LALARNPYVQFLIATGAHKDTSLEMHHAKDVIWHLALLGFNILIILHLLKNEFILLAVKLHIEMR
jgi:hypothetical protein